MNYLTDCSNELYSHSNGFLHNVNMAKVWSSLFSVMYLLYFIFDMCFFSIGKKSLSLCQGTHIFFCLHDSVCVIIKTPFIALIRKQASLAILLLAHTYLFSFVLSSWAKVRTSAGAVNQAELCKAQFPKWEGDWWSVTRIVCK